MPIALLAIAGLAAYFLFFSKGGLSGPTRPAATPDQVANAVQVALLNETDPTKLDEFANSLQPDYAQYATELHAKAAVLRAGGNVLPPPGVVIPASTNPVIQPTAPVFAIWSLTDFEAMHPGVSQFLDASTPPHALRENQKLVLFLHDSSGGFIPVSASVDDPDPNATRGYVIASVDYQTPGGPAPGTHFHLSTTNEDDMYLDDNIAGNFLAGLGTNT